jgi:hypothetical protein
MNPLLLQQDLGSFVKYKVLARPFTLEEQFQSRTVPSIDSKNSLNGIEFCPCPLGDKAYLCYRSSNE